MRLYPVDTHGKTADPVTRRIDKIRQAHIGTVTRFLHLLAQEGQRYVLVLTNVQRDIVFIAGAGPEACDTARCQPFFVYNLVEHFLRIRKQTAGAFANHIVFQDGGIIAVEFPCPEKRRPIDDFAQIGQRPVVENVKARFRRRRRLVAQVGLEGVGARFLQAQQRALPLSSARYPDFFVIAGCRLDKFIALRVG